MENSKGEEELPPTHFRYRGTILHIQTPSDHCERALKINYKPSDIFVITYPRNGTLLTQEIVWHIKNRATIRRGEKYGPMHERFPYLEYHSPDTPRDTVDMIEKREDDPCRLIKSHLPEHIVHPVLRDAAPKIVLVIRNPKDVAVSNFHFYQSFDTYYGGWPHNDWDLYMRHFLNGTVWYGSYFDWYTGWLKQSHLPNLLLVQYEDIILDRRAQIKRIAEFLEEGEITEEQIEIIEENSLFDFMSNNDRINVSIGSQSTLMRKGAVGDWKNYFSEEQSNKVDQLVAKNLSQFGLTFKYAV